MSISKKKIAFVIVLFSIAIIGFTQPAPLDQKYVDSITKLLPHYPNDSNKVNLYNKITSKRTFKLSASFFDFLYELDYSAFAKLYLIPMIEELVESPFTSGKDEFDNYTHNVIIEFLRKNPNFSYVKSSDSGFYIADFMTILEKLKKEVQTDLNDNSNPLFDILN